MLQALCLAGNERRAFIEQQTRGNAALRDRVEALLGSYESGAFLEDPADPSLQKITASSSLGERAGDWIGRYKLLEKFGERGGGVVYVAAQENPVKRLVALKIVKLGMDTKSVVARFEAERQALALMDHPNIAKVLDGGAADSGRPYFVMELVRGIKITDYCDEAKLSIRRRLDLFIRVCQAVQHAHQKGVIHRDIKSFRRLPFSSGRGTVVSSFSNGISHVYTRGALSSSGENRGTCRKKIMSLSLELRASRVRSRHVESYDTRVPPYLYRRTNSHLSP